MLTNSYAMAEAVFAVTQSPVGQAAFRLVVDRETLQVERRLVPCERGTGGIELMSAGRLLPGIRMAVLDDTGKPRADGEIGQIALAGEFVFGGYHNNAAATAAAFRDGWYLTGDLGVVMDGEIFITGREKDIIIVNGRNFYAHDIEASAARVAGIKPGRAVAFGIDNAVTGSEEVVVVAETEHTPEQYRELAAAVKLLATEELGLSAIRVHPVPLRWLVKTTSGKIARGENRQKYLAAKTGRNQWTL